MAVVCREAQAGDAEALAELAKQLGYRVSAAELAERLQRLNGRADQRAIVADGEGVVLGWTTCRISESLHEQAHVEISGFVVDRSARRQGVGRVLMAAVAAWGRQQGVASIQLGANVIRTDAHRFYGALGFVDLKRHVRFAIAIDPPA